VTNKKNEITNDDRIFYSSSEMARRCGVHITTWCAWVRKGTAPQPVWVGNARRWLASDVQRWEGRLKKKSNVVVKAAGKD
jgi:predicted DNA-binding transcriptional regulator AlpA